MTTKKPDEDDPLIRPFASFIRELAGGRTHAELGESLHLLVSRVTDTGKKGQLILMIEVGPMKGDPETLVVTDKIRTKLPEHDRKPAVFWADKDGNLTRDNPAMLPFEELKVLPPVETADGPVDPETGEIIKEKKA